MTIKNRIIVWVVLLLVVFVIAFLPQYLQVRKVTNDLRAAEFKIKLAQLRDHAALVYLEAGQKNYGIAAQHATEFFNQLRQVANETPDQTMKKALEDLLAARDTITAGLAKGDPAVLTEALALLTRIHETTR